MFFFLALRSRRSDGSNEATEATAATEATEAMEASEATQTMEATEPTEASEATEGAVGGMWSSTLARLIQGNRDVDEEREETIPFLLKRNMGLGGACKRRDSQPFWKAFLRAPFKKPFLGAPYRALTKP